MFFLYAKTYILLIHLHSYKWKYVNTNRVREYIYIIGDELLFMMYLGNVVLLSYIIPCFKLFIC